MKNLKKPLSLILAFSMVTSVFQVTALASEGTEVTSMEDINNQLAKQTESGEFRVIEGDVCVTGCVLVKDGKSYVLSEEEYLRNKSNVQEESVYENGKSVQNENNSARSITREFIPSRKTVKSDESKIGRVTAIYDTANLANVSVTDVYTFTRTYSTSQGVTLSAADLDVIDTEVSATYSLSKSASSSRSTSVTGTFNPSGNYKYMAVVFIPDLATVKGTYKVYGNIMGSAEIGSYDCTLVYPVSNGKILDGEYRVYEANTKSSFPKLAP